MGRLLLCIPWLPGDALEGCLHVAPLELPPVPLIYLDTFNCSRIITGDLLAHRFNALSPLSWGQPTISVLGASELCQPGYFCARCVPAACRRRPSERIMSFAGLGRSRPQSHYLSLWFHPLSATHQRNKRSQRASLGRALVLTGRRLQLEAGYEGTGAGCARGLCGRGWLLRGLFGVGRGAGLFPGNEVKMRCEVP